jgi:heme-degrading monooxygenase HmoA
MLICLNLRSQSWRLLGGLGLMLMVGLAWPGFAWADKAPSPLVFDASEGAITVITLYETTADTQKDAFKTVFKTSSSFYKKISGFDSFAVLASSDGERVLELTQWQDQASYDAFQASLQDDSDEDYSKYYEKYKKKQSEGGVSEPLFTATFALDQAVAPPGLVATIPGPDSLVQISLISPTSATGQAAVLTAAQATFLTLPDLYPSPRSALLLAGVDTPEVLLVANWGALAEFADLDQVPQLTVDLEPTVTLDNPADTDAPADAAAPLATADDHLFQIVKVIAPKSDDDR